ncbi:MAG: phosphate acyltransferase PlsX [Chloroflexia bacterium]|nr:phosphate acyltransferase PlsX [Chloroflexia bacterium]
MRIVLDAMGGDHAPGIPVAGAVAAARAYELEIVLVGREEEVRAELSRHDTAGLSLPIVHAPDVIEMHDHAAMAVRRNKDSSIVRGVYLVRDGEAEAFVSAGHSGAVMAAATLVLGRLPGVERPALATAFPHPSGTFLLVDIGANTDCRPEYLLQFAYMGAVYAEGVFGLRNPRIALIANGEEESKGDRLVQQAHALLREAPGLHFVGNVEPKDMLLHNAAEVVVADGFVGNMVVKSTEAAAALFETLLREELSRSFWSKLGAGLFLRPAFRRVKARLDYREYGGALLLGLRGVTIIAHGRSDAYAIQNAVRVACESVSCGAVEAVAQALQAIPATPDQH